MSSIMAASFVTRKETSPSTSEISGDSAVSMSSISMTADADDEDDWQGSRSILECNKQMLTQQLDCDITFICGESKELVGAHKYVLTSRSNVFHAMFRGRLAETDSTITIPDIEVDIFMTMLRFLYYEEVSLQTSSIIALLYAAKKYNIRQLISHCVEHLEQSVDTDNALVILEQAHLFSEDGLKQRVLDFICHNANSILTSPDFANLCLSCFGMIISSDNLRVCDDVVLTAAIFWAEAECIRKGLETCDENKRLVLGDMIYHIRFTLLDPKMFVQEMSKSSVLSADEKVSILSHFIDDSIPVARFCDRRRKMSEFWRPVRFVAVEHSQWMCQNGTDAISFSSDIDILLHGFLIYRARRTESQQTLSISSQLYNDENKIIYQHHEECDTSKQPDMCDILFRSSVQLKAGRQYTLELIARGTCTVSGKGGRSTVTRGNATLTFRNSEKSTTGTCLQRGQIPGLILAFLDD